MDSHDDGEWETIPSKQMKQQQQQQRKQRKAAQLQERRDTEKREHDEKQRRIKEMFSDSANAFTLKSEKRYNNPWEVLEDGDDGGNDPQRHAPKKKKVQPNVNKDGFVYTSKYLNELEKKKAKAIQKQREMAAKKKQQIDNTKKKGPTSFDNVKETFQYNQFYELMIAVVRKYPTSRDIQLKYIAEFLEEHFGKVELEISLADLVIEANYEYPVSTFDKRFVKETTKYFDNIATVDYIPTITFLINTLLAIIKQEKGALKTSGVGLIIFLQIVFKYVKAVPLAMIETFKTVFASAGIHNLKPNVASLYLWLASQAFPTYPEVPVSLWFSFVFPLKLNQHLKIPAAVNDYLQSYSTSVLAHCNDIQSDESRINESIITYSVEQLLWAIQKGYHLDDICLTVGQLLFDVDKLFPSKAIPHPYLHVLLSNTAIADENYREIILSSLIKCLKLDPNSLEYIKKVYPKNVAQTNNLLLFISLNWSQMNLRHSLSAESIYNLALFCKQNNDAVLSSKTKKKAMGKNVDINDIEMCSVTCDSIIRSFKPSAMTSSKTMRVLLPLLILPLVVACGLFARQHLCSGQYNDRLPAQLSQLSQLLCNSNKNITLP